jgi:hypothetical protein
LQCSMPSSSKRPMELTDLLAAHLRPPCARCRPATSGHGSGSSFPGHSRNSASAAPCAPRRVPHRREAHPS